MQGTFPSGSGQLQGQVLGALPSRGKSCWSVSGRAQSSQGGLFPSTLRLCAHGPAGGHQPPRRTGWELGPACPPRGPRSSPGLGSMSHPSTRATARRRLALTGAALQVSNGEGALVCMKGSHGEKSCRCQAGGKGARLEADAIPVTGTQTGLRGGTPEHSLGPPPAAVTARCLLTQGKAPIPGFGRDPRTMLKMLRPNAAGGVRRSTCVQLQDRVSAFQHGGTEEEHLLASVRPYGRTTPIV